MKAGEHYFHPDQCKMKFNFFLVLIFESDRHAVSPRPNYFIISDDKKRENDGNHFNIFPTSPVLKLLNYKVYTRRIVMLTWF